MKMQLVLMLICLPSVFAQVRSGKVPAAIPPDQNIPESFGGRITRLTTNGPPSNYWILLEVNGTKDYRLNYTTKATKNGYEARWEAGLIGDWVGGRYDVKAKVVTHISFTTPQVQPASGYPRPKTNQPAQKKAE